MSAEKPAPASAPKPPRKPWPMSGVAVAIVICLAAYTYVRIKYSKPNHGHEPFAEARQRVESAKLKQNGWERFDIAWERTVDFPEPRGNVRTVDARPPLREDLLKSTNENWYLPIEYLRVTAPAEVAAADSYTVYAEAQLDGARAQIVSFDAYRKGADVLLVPRTEQIPAELIPRTVKPSGRMLWPAGKLPAGQYRVLLLANRQAAEWDLRVTAN